MFATVDDLIRKFGEAKLKQLVSYSGTDPISSIPRINQAINVANSRVAAHVRMQNENPLVSIPADLTDVACSLTYWTLLTSERGKIGDGDLEVYWTQPMSYLQEFVATGKIRYEFKTQEQENFDAQINSVATFQPQDNPRIMGQNWIRVY